MLTLNECFVHADDCLDIATEASEAERQAFISDCTSGTVTAAASDGDGIKLFHDKLTNKKTGKAGFDPSVIIAIITAIVQMIANCPKPPTPAQLQRRFGNRARIAWAIYTS